MQIDNITIYLINLPFSLQFSHALGKRSSVKNIIVKVDADQGKIKGYGEGAPRSFVTRETPKGAVKSILRLIRQDHFPWDMEDVSQIWDFIDSLSNKKIHNAAECSGIFPFRQSYEKSRGSSDG